MGLSDTLLAGGCALQIAAIHGELVLVTTGADAGTQFTAVREIASDVTLDSELVADLRAKRVLRFRQGQPIPRLVPQDIIQTCDGQRWHATRNPQDGYLETVFDLVAIVAGTDTV